MPERQPEPPGVSNALQSVTERLSAIAKLEGELAGREVNRKMRKLLVAIVLAISGAVLLGLAVVVALAAIAAGLATAVDPWLAILILFGGLVAVALAVLIPALIIFRRAEAPKPDQALEEARATAAVLKGHGGEPAAD